MRFRGIPATGRQFTALNRALEHAFEIMDHVWVDVHRGPKTVDITAPVCLCSTRIPSPPDGYVILVEGWANFEWASATAVDMNVNIERGTLTLADNRLHTETTASGNAISCASKAVDNPTDEATYRLMARLNSGLVDFTVNTHGIVGRYIVDKGGS